MLHFAFSTWEILIFTNLSSTNNTWMPSLFVSTLCYFFIFLLSFDGWRWHLHKTKICIFFIISEVEYLFMHIRAKKNFAHKLLSHSLPMFQLKFIIFKIEEALWKEKGRHLSTIHVCEYHFAIYFHLILWFFQCRHVSCIPLFFPIIDWIGLLLYKVINTESSPIDLFHDSSLRKVIGFLCVFVFFILI